MDTAISRWPIALNGQPVTRGLLPVKGAKPSLIKRLTYEQPENNFTDKFMNIFRLEDTKDLKGLDLFETRLKNLVAVYYNPFATIEYWKQAFNGNIL